MLILQEIADTNSVNTSLKYRAFFNFHIFFVRLQTPQIWLLDTLEVILLCCFASVAGALLDAIKKDFGSLEAMQSQLSAATVAVQGSGWGWLGYNKQKKALQIATCPNQVATPFKFCHLPTPFKFYHLP